MKTIRLADLRLYARMIVQSDFIMIDRLYLALVHTRHGAHDIIIEISWYHQNDHTYSISPYEKVVTEISPEIKQIVNQIVNDVKALDMSVDQFINLTYLGGLTIKPYEEQFFQYRETT